MPLRVPQANHVSSRRSEVQGKSTFLLYLSSKRGFISEIKNVLQENTMSNYEYSDIKKTSKNYSQEDIDLFSIIKLASNFFIFITNQSNLMYCVAIITFLAFGNPLQS